MLTARAPRNRVEPATLLARPVRIGLLVAGAAAAAAVFVLLLTTNVPYDAWNYLAAGERLNAGHPLYALSPGDRPVELKPPFWTVPLLSPPLIAVVWRPLALLPGDLGLAAWWSATTLTLGAVVAAVATRRPVLTVALSVLLAYPLLTELYVGNVNPLILAGLVGVWLLMRSGRDGWAGAVLGLLVAIKVTPIVLVWWLVVGDRRRALRGFLVGICAALAVSLFGAGVDAHMAYFDVMRHTNSVGQSSISLPALARAVGVPDAYAPFVTLLAVAAGGFIVLLLRHRPAVSFIVALVTMIGASPVVTPGSLTLLLAGLAPSAWAWLARPTTHALWRPHDDGQVVEKSRAVTRFPDWAIRTVKDFGPERLLRIIAITVVTVAALDALTIRLDPAHAFVDPYTYMIAGERLNAGHRLYEIGPGDRPMHSGQTVLVRFPFLSPPPVGVLAMPFAALGQAGILVWWATIATGALFAVTWYLTNGRWPTLLLLIFLAVPLGHVIWLGNLNGLLIGLLPMIWLARCSPYAAGVLVGVAAAVKLTPIILLAWLGVAVGRRAVIACLATLAATLAVTVLAAGVENISGYMEVVLGTASHGFTPSSATAVIQNAAGAPLFLALAALLTVALRRRTRLAFAVAILGTIWGSPIVYFHTLPLMLAALAPYSDSRRDEDRRGRMEDHDR